MSEKEQFPYRYITSHEIEEMYNSVEGLIVKHTTAVYTMSQGRLEFEDLLSEAKIIFMKTLHNYDATRGAKFSTILSTCLKNRLYDILKVQSKRYYRETASPMENSDEEDKLFENAIQITSVRRNGNRLEEDELHEKLIKKEFYELLDSIADEYFSEDEQRVYRLYFRSDVKRKIQEVANLLGLKKYQVSDAKKNIIAILRNHLLEHDIEQLREDYLDGLFTTTK